MYIPLRNSHSLGYCVRIEDRSSVPFALPFVGVTRSSVGVLLQGKIRAESRNALKCRPNWRAQVRVVGHLVQQFSRDNLPLDGVTDNRLASANGADIPSRANPAVFLSHEIAP